MRSIFIALLLLICSPAFCDAISYESVKKSLKNGYAAWQSEYQQRHNEALQAGYNDPTFYHQLWYAKGQMDAYEYIMNISEH